MIDHKYLILLVVMLMVVMMLCVYVSTILVTKEGFGSPPSSDENISPPSVIELSNTVGYTDLYAHKSDYQDIAIIKFNKNPYGVNKCMVLDNEIQLCDHDENTYHEYIVHFPAAYLSKLERVLIVGGGDCMVLREVMKYPSIKHVDMLEIDKQVIDVSKRYFGVSTYDNDSRVKIIIGDASKTIDELTVKYDLIIIDSTEDSNNNIPIQSIDFFDRCRKRLMPSGILVKNDDYLSTYWDLQTIFKYLLIYKVHMTTFNNSYKFVCCSNGINFSDRKLLNPYTDSLQLTRYKKSNHFDNIGE